MRGTVTPDAQASQALLARRNLYRKLGAFSRSQAVNGQVAVPAGGRMEGGYIGMFELICLSCGDHPYQDYSEVPPRLQWLRGPRTLEGGLAAYEKHLGLVLRPGSLGA